MRHKEWGMELLSYKHLNSKDCAFSFSSSLQSIVHDLHCVLLIQGIKIGGKGWANKQNSSSEPSHLLTQHPFTLPGYPFHELLSALPNTIFIRPAHDHCQGHSMELNRLFTAQGTQMKGASESWNPVHSYQENLPLVPSWEGLLFVGLLCKCQRKSLKILPRSSQGKWSELQ